jgi:hypothetical protein
MLLGLESGAHSPITWDGMGLVGMNQARESPTRLLLWSYPFFRFEASYSGLSCRVLERGVSYCRHYYIKLLPWLLSSEMTEQNAGLLELMKGMSQ